MGWTAVSALLNLVSYILRQQMSMVTYQCPLFVANEPPTAAASTASSVTKASAALKMNVLSLRPPNRLQDDPGCNGIGVCDACAPTG